MSRLRTLLRSEEGLAMPVALAVLVLCVAITAVVAEGADRLTGTSGRDQDGKRALAAADAGVSVATRRLRALVDLPAASCLTSTGVAPGSAGAAPGECPGWTEALGAGAQFTYHVSPASTAPNGCYEVPGADIPAGWLRRCITSTGTADGITRRVQAQVVTKPPGPGHWIGILGSEHVELRNSAQLSACYATQTPGPRVGSNQSISIANGTVMNAVCPSKVWGVEMPAGRTPDIHDKAKPEGAIPRTVAPAPFVIPPPPRGWEDVEDDNDNASVTSAAKTGSVSWDPGARHLAIGNSGRVVLAQGGDLHVCSIDLQNSAILDIATAERVRLFIDSPDRPGSQCTGATGFRVGNSGRFNWPTSLSDGDHAALGARSKNVEIYLYDGDARIDNSGRFAGLLQAERSTVEFVNSSLTWGSVAANRVILANSGGFQVPDGINALPPDGVRFRSVGWAQCSSTRTAPLDPESGC